MNFAPMAAIREAVCNILEADPQIVVTRVFSNDMFVGGKSVAYPYVASMTYDVTDEAARGSGMGTAEVDILVNASCETDPAKQGIKTIVAAEVISRIKYRLETFNLSTLETNDDTRYRTHILAIAVDGNVGDFDDGSGKIRIGISTTVIFGLEHTP